MSQPNEEEKRSNPEGPEEENEMKPICIIPSHFLCHVEYAIVFSN
jgi:hypothetical protein